MTTILYPPDFLEFWRAYPRRVGKLEAFKAWKKLGPVNGLMPVILASISEHQKTEQWQTRKFIPHPSTFISQRRWEDELTEADKQAKKPTLSQAIEEACQEEANANTQ